MTPMKRPDFDKLCADTFALLGHRFDSPAARAMLWAIGRQEGRMVYRRQIGGPARGLWQFERGGGCRGVLTHPSSKAHAESLCSARGVQPIAAAVYPKLEHDDVLACGFARLLLWTDAATLPAPVRASEQDAWRYYVRNWRPGKPHPETWPDFWAEACEVVK
jgi:hypothetical protein